MFGQRSNCAKIEVAPPLKAAAKVTSVLEKVSDADPFRQFGDVRRR